MVFLVTPPNARSRSSRSPCISWQRARRSSEWGAALIGQNAPSALHQCRHAHLAKRLYAMAGIEPRTSTSLSSATTSPAW